MKKWVGFNIMVVACGALLFGLSIHGIDLAVNYMHIHSDYGIDLVDKTPVGAYQTPEQIYTQSLLMLIISFVITISGVVGTCRSASEESGLKQARLETRK